MTEEQVFLGALDLPNGADRAAYLDEVCGQNSERRRQVEELLAAHERSGQFLDEAAAEQMAAGPQSPTAQTVALNPESDDVMADGKKTNASPSDDGVDDLPFLSPSTRPDSLGRLGHYEILQVLGRGGFGVVFRAFDDVLQRVVAVKVLSPQLAATSPARRRFLREARSSAQVRHENVVQVHEVGENPLPYIAMEFIPGETLQQRLDRTGPIDVADVVRIGRQIAEGLAAAHATDLIHRDIKPGNVLLEGGAQRVKITDFGLARAADDASLSQSGMIAGTPMYMSPEQAKGEKIDQRADLFSLGSVLYVMAAGRPPFRATGMLGVLKRVAEDQPRPIREIIPETPQWLCDVIAKLHAKDPDDRYQSAREVADVLADCEAQLKANARLKDFSRIPQSKPVSRQRRSGLMLVVLLLVGFLVLAAIGSGAVIAALWLFASLNGGSQPSVTPEVTKMVATSGADPAPVVASKPNPLPPTFKNGIGMEFVIVPKGKSWLGGDREKPGDREVVIPADFYLGKYAVTQEEWEKVMGENPSYFSRFGNGKDAVKEINDEDLKRFPVENVSWEDCQFFVAKLNQRERETGWVYRLPKDVEWEYACRGGPMSLSNKADSAFDFYFAKPTNTLLPEQANFDKVLNRTCKVGSYEPNALGLHDMHGNVWEYCDFTNKPAKLVAPGSIRGGCWDNVSGRCRAAGPGYSLGFGTKFRVYGIGLRLARVPAGAPSPFVKTLPAAAAAADISGWGEPLDPDKDCEFRAVGTSLSVKVPGTLHDLSFDKLNAPRALKEIDGDFVLTVKVAGDFQPRGPSTTPEAVPAILAGILLWSDDDNFIRLERAAVLRNDEISTFVNLQEQKDGKRGPNTGPMLPAGTCYFRAERRGNRITGAVSSDGSTWKEVTPIEVTWPRKLQVGVAAISSSSEAFTVTFDEFSLKASGKDKPSSPAIGPFTDADVQRIAALPAAEQVEEVRKELMRRNPGFDGALTPTIETDVVTGLAFSTEQVSDISPVRA